MRQHKDTDKKQQLAVERVVKCRKTSRYFSGDGWDSNISAAQTFPNQLEAVRTSIAQDLHDVDLIIRVRDTGTVLYSSRLR